MKKLFWKKNLEQETNFDPPVARHPKIAFIHTIPKTTVLLYWPLPERLRQKGYDVVLCFGSGPEADVFKKKGFKVKEISISRSPFSPGNLRAVLELARYLRSEEIDIVETSTPVASIIGRTAAVLAGVPVKINTVRGSFPRETHLREYRLFNFAEKFLSKKTTFAITINETDKLEFIEKGYADRENIINMGCGGVGVDLSEFNRSTGEGEISERKENLGINPNDYVITYIGRLTEEKGIGDFLQVSSTLNEKGMDFKALVVGDTFEGEHHKITIDDIRKYVSEHDLEERVVLTGYSRDLPGILSVSDVLVLPTKREGFGLVIAEAAAMGLPAVAYRCRGTEEAIIEGETGVLVDNGNVELLTDAVEELGQNENKRNSLGEAAFARAKAKFDQERVLGKYVEVFDKYSAGLHVGGRV